MVASVLLLPLQASAQSGGAAGATTGTAGSTATPPGTTTSPTGSPSATMPGPPGTNSLGTAQSSGRGATIGSAGGPTAEDKKIEDENRDVERKLRGICKGC
jgi:hypothetical protein